MAEFESFFWGILAALGALVIEIIFFIIISPFTDPNGLLSFTQFFIMPQFIIAAACIEEILKYTLIFKSFQVLPPEKLRFTSALLIGLGFFLFELVLILVTRISPAPQSLIEIAILHVGTAGIIGYIIIKNIKKVAAFIYAIVTAVAFHAAYNLLSLERNIWENYSIFFILGLLLAVNIAIFFRVKHISYQEPV